VENANRDCLVKIVNTYDKSGDFAQKLAQFQRY